MTAVWFSKRWLYSLQTRVPATILALLAFFWCKYRDIHFPGIEEPMEIPRLSSLTIAASIAYAGSKNPHISIAMALYFCTSLCHFDLFTKNAIVHVLQIDTLSKNSYQLGVIASACFSQNLFNIFKSNTASEKDKRKTLISVLFTLAAFVITLFVPSDGILAKDSRDWSETVAFLVGAWVLERALSLVGTLPRLAMLINVYGIITRSFIVRAADSFRVARTMRLTSSNGIATYAVFVTFAFFALVFSHTCLRRVYDAVQHYSCKDISVAVFLCSALNQTTLFLLYSTYFSDGTYHSKIINACPHAMLCITLNLLVLFISIKVQRPEINPKSKSEQFHRIWTQKSSDQQHDQNCEWSEDARFLVDFEECKAKIHEMVSNAKQTVY